MAGETKQLAKGRVRIGDASSVAVQNQDAIRRRFKQPAVAEFGSLRCFVVFDNFL